MAAPATPEERLQAQAERVRASGVLGRSDVLVRLFDFLLARTLAGRPPKEIEIAQDVFDRTSGFDVSLDASVRVYIHRLRRKVEAFYADQGEGDRLYIPKGEYRLAIERAPAAEAPPPPPAAEAAGWRRGWTTRRAALAAASALLLLGLGYGAAWLTVGGGLRADPLRAVVASPFWSPLATDGRPTILVTGDYYIFGEAPDGMDVQRLIREFSINSKDDLDQYLMAHPTQAGRYVDMELHYLPTSIPPALRDVLPVVARVARIPPGRELLAPMSQLTPDMLKKANIVYVGYLSALGLLRDPVFAASGLQPGSSYDELVDRRSGRRFVSDQGDAAGRTSPRRDYAYIAALPGPAGGRVLIVAGARDAGVMQAAEIVGDPRQLARIEAAAGGAPAFEALYEVRTLDALNFGNRLVLARGLRSDWLKNLDQPRASPFPDEMPPAR